MYILNDLEVVVVEVVAVMDVTTGHGLRVRLSWDNLGPINSPCNVPPARIVYVAPQANPSTVTTAVLLVAIGALPTYVIM